MDEDTGVITDSTRLTRDLEVFMRTERCSGTVSDLCTTSYGWEVPDIQNLSQDIPSDVQTIILTLCADGCMKQIDGNLALGMFDDFGNPNWVLDDYLGTVNPNLSSSDVSWSVEDFVKFNGLVSGSYGWRLKNGELYYSQTYKDRIEVEIPNTATNSEWDIRLTYNSLAIFQPHFLYVLGYQTANGLFKNEQGRISEESFQVVGETCGEVDICIPETTCCSGVCHNGECTTSSDSSGTDTATVIIIFVAVFVTFLLLMVYLYVRGYLNKILGREKELDDEPRDYPHETADTDYYSDDSHGRDSAHKQHGAGRDSPRKRHDRSESRRNGYPLEVGEDRYDNMVTQQKPEPVSTVSPHDSISNVDGPTIKKRILKEGEPSNISSSQGNVVHGNKQPRMIHKKQQVVKAQPTNTINVPALAHHTQTQQTLTSPIHNNQQVMTASPQKIVNRVIQQPQTQYIQAQPHQSQVIRQPQPSQSPVYIQHAQPQQRYVV
eukprot:UN22561